MAFTYSADTHMPCLWFLTVFFGPHPNSLCTHLLPTRSMAFTYSADTHVPRDAGPLPLHRFISSRFNRHGRGLNATFYFGQCAGDCGSMARCVYL